MYLPNPSAMDLMWYKVSFLAEYTGLNSDFSFS